MKLIKTIRAYLPLIFLIAVVASAVYSMGIDMKPEFRVVTDGKVFRAEYRHGRLFLTHWHDCSYTDRDTREEALQDIESRKQFDINFESKLEKKWTPSTN